MHIGQLDKYVTIQRRSATLDDYGQKSDSWSDVCNAWTNIRPISGREKMRNGVIESTISHTIAMHFNPVLMPLIEADSLRIVHVDDWSSRIFNVQSAINFNEQYQWIVFECEEGGATGD